MDDRFQAPAWQRRHLALIGFMGAGKTSVGRLIAQRLGRPFFDTDAVVEERSGRAIPDFFRVGDEPVFRALEAQTIRSLLDAPPTVLSLGGGALQDERTRALVLERCFVVHLFVSWADVRAALPSLLHHRPLLQGRSEREIHDLYIARARTYRDAHLCVETPRGNLPAAADAVLSRLVG